MPEYLSPGVYVEEIDAGPKPIEGVSTSTAGAVGVTLLGPTSGKPELVTSFAEFQRKFGGFIPEPDGAAVTQALDPDNGGRWWQFPLAVKGFFDNGGQRIYIKRVFSSTAKSSATNLGTGIVSELEKDTAVNATIVKVRSLAGIAVNLNAGPISLRIFRGDGTPAIGSFTVTSYDPQTREITLGAAIPEALSVKRGDFIEVVPRTGGPVSDANTTLKFEAKSKGDWGNALSVRVRPMIGSTYRILSDPVNGGAQSKTAVAQDAKAGDTVITLDSVAGFTDKDHVQIDGREYKISAVTAGPPATFTVDPPLPGGDEWKKGTSVQRLRPASAANSNKLNIWGAASLYTDALVELDNGTDKEIFTVDSVAGDTVTLSGNAAGPYFEGHNLRVIEAEVSARYAPEGAAPTIETFGNLRLVKDGSLSNIVNNIKEQSTLIDVSEGAAYQEKSFVGFPGTTNGSWQTMAGGDDQLAKLGPDDFVGTDGGSGKRTGIQALEDIDEISICLAPGMWAGIIHSALIQHCEILKDRFAILDPKDGLSIEKIQAVREGLDTKYAALYYPAIEVRDPSVRRNVVMAPSGHMAGIYARVDVERGVHKAPANEVIRGITKIAQEVTKREQDMLNTRNINVLRFFPGRGDRVWGARVVTSDSAWKYINVRRLFIYVEESIDEGTQWVVFEPNDEPLWARVRATITNFLISTWRSGALQGAKPDEAFFVKCDRTTMTQDDIDNGRLICLIGIAPVKPAEFVIFRIQQKTLETKVS